MKLIIATIVALIFAVNFPAFTVFICAVFILWAGGRDAKALNRILFPSRQEVTASKDKEEEGFDTGPKFGRVKHRTYEQMKEDGANEYKFKEGFFDDPEVKAWQKEMQEIMTRNRQKAKDEMEQEGI